MAVISQERLYRRRIQRHAELRLNFAPDEDNDSILEPCKEFLRLEFELLERHHRKGAGGFEIALERTEIIDTLVRRLFARARARCEQTSGRPLEFPVSLVALGGYGRMELSPHSDVDIMLLYPDRPRAKNFPAMQEQLADSLLYPLWDLGLQTGHSTRTPKQAIEEASKDILTKNSLLEARIVAGDNALFSHFTKVYRRYCRRTQDAYIQQRLADQEYRRARHGNTVFLQEPDIKNGVGGLRDYHNILWIIRLILNSDSIEDLLTRDYLDPGEYRDFVAAYEFLLHVRNELHFQSRRPTEVLHLDQQSAIAWSLNYRQQDIFERVEAFMKDYYRHAQHIYLTSRYLEQRFAIDSNSHSGWKEVLESRRMAPQQELDGFLFRGGVLETENPDVFVEDPERMIRVFRHAQQVRARIDFELRRLIRENLHLIDARLIQSPTANRSFRSILQSVGEVYPSLQLMHEIGVLQRFLPEFAPLVCLVQHEYYHRYTADVHTLTTIAELDKVFNSVEEHTTGKYKRELHETEIPSLLYLVLLLHDIGKGSGASGHADRGAQLAGPVLERIGVKPELHRKILFIIRNHLEMARFWQRYDVDDPRTAEAFAEFVGTAEQLRLLYVHNFCDARGTAGGLWNSYKDMLHTELFRNTLLQLGEKPRIPAEKRMIPQNDIRDRLPELSDDEIEAHYNLLPERYFVFTPLDEVVLHLRMVNRLLLQIDETSSVGSLVPMVEWTDDLSLSMSVVHVVTWDRAGLFCKLAGAFSAAGLSIVSSKALTRADHITIDTFYVCQPGGGVVQEERTRTQFQEHLEEALLQNKDLLPAIIAQQKRLAKPSYLKQRDILEAQIPPSVNVYHELNLRRTIIEVQATDQVGLLYRLARAIYEHGFDITFARISTERHVAVDTFYIENIDTHKSQEASNLLDLRESLTQIVDPAHGSSQPPA